MVLYTTGKLNAETDGEGLMSSPRQSETVWFRRVKLCNVA